MPHTIGLPLPRGARGDLGPEPAVGTIRALHAILNIQREGGTRFRPEILQKALRIVGMNPLFPAMAQLLL